jgi:hypothetical protein
MTDDLPTKRPKCEEILNRKKFWAFNKNEFKNETEFIAVLSYTGNEEVYNSLIIETTLQKQSSDSEIDSKYIQKLMTVKELFSNQEKSETIFLSILWSYRLHTLEFDRSKCLELVLDSLVNIIGKGIHNINIFKALEICLKLSSMMSIMDILNFCPKLIHIEVLLEIIYKIVHSKSDDENNILGLTLDLLMKLTDFSTEICEMFSQKGAINLYLLILIVRF